MRACQKILLFLCAVLLASWCMAGEAVPATGSHSSGKETVSANASTEKAHFDVWEFRVEGASLLDQQLVERTVYPFLGSNRTIEDIEKAGKALQTVYRDAGYPTVIVNIPEQDVRDTVVRLQVVEGKISRVRVTGSRYFSLDSIRKEIPALTKGVTPNLPALQKQIRKVNALTPDRRVTPVFRPGRTPGTVEVDLKVRDEFPLHAEMELTGRNSRDTTRSRLSTTLRYSNLFQKGHSASLMLMTAPENTDEVKVASLTYVMPLKHRSDVLAAYGVVTRSDVATAGDITVLGDGTIFGARYIHPLTGLKKYFHSTTLGIDYKDFSESLKPIGTDALNTPIDYVSFSVSYRGTLLQKTGRSIFGAGLHFGLRGLGNHAKEFENKRFNAVPNFIYITAFGEHDVALPYDFTLHGALNGQLSNSPLVSNEEFTAGGAESVRGYFESQALGDDGIRGSLELRSPSLAAHVSHFLRKLSLYSFLDGARLRVQDPLPGQATRTILYGAGAGFRLSGPGKVEADFSLAWPLRDDGGVKRGDTRSHFRMFYGF